MAATNAVITRISFGVIMLQQSGLRRFLFGIAGIGENWKKGKWLRHNDDVLSRHHGRAHSIHNRARRFALARERHSRKTSSRRGLPGVPTIRTPRVRRRPPAMTPTSQPSPAPNAAEELEREVDEAIALCGSDVRAALRATLVANAFLDVEVERLTRAVPRGFTRSKMRPPRQASETLDDWRKISSGE
jgi:hypothetical protein